MFKSAVVDTANDFALGLLFVNYPFLDWWPLNSIIRWIEGMIETDSWNMLTTLVNVEYIVFRNEATQALFASSQLALKQIALQSGVDSAPYKAQRITNQTNFAAHVRSLLVKAA